MTISDRTRLIVTVADPDLLPDHLVEAAIRLVEYLGRLAIKPKDREEPLHLATSLAVPEGCVPVVATVAGVFFRRHCTNALPFATTEDPVGHDQLIGVIDSEQPRVEVFAGAHGLFMGALPDGSRVDADTVVAIIAIPPSERTT